MDSFKRPFEGRWIAGVCIGLARQLGINVTAIRIIALITAPVSVWIYVVLWGFTGNTTGRQPF